MGRILVLGWLVLPFLAGCQGGRVVEIDPDQDRVLAFVREIGGSTDVDNEGSDIAVKVNLNGTAITDAELEYLLWLTNLQTLFLRGTETSDAGLTYLKELPNLKTVDLRETRVTADGLKGLQTAMPGLLIFH